MKFICNVAYGEIQAKVEEYKEKYLSAQPFPHIVIDHFFRSSLLIHLADQFPKPRDGTWWKYDNVLERKLAKNNLEELPEAMRHLVWELQSNHFVSLLEKITGIEGLITDHTLNGGGLHQIVRGGKLDIHADYNYHPITRLDRRLNVLLYLNPSWLSSYNGNLELWDANMSVCEQSIMPIFNRMVIFSVTDTAYHGHPDPLQCPEDQSRKSIALYYYTNGRPAHEKTEPHSTIFKRRPQDPILEEHELLRQQRAKRRFTS